MGLLKLCVGGFANSTLKLSLALGALTMEHPGRGFKVATDEDVWGGCPDPFFWAPGGRLTFSSRKKRPLSEKKGKKGEGAVVKKAFSS